MIKTKFKLRIKMVKKTYKVITDLKIQKKQKHPELPVKIKIFNHAELNLSYF
jgi:hypothetical protein